MKSWLAALAALFSLCLQGLCATNSNREGGLAETRSPYVWTSVSVDNTAQLVTLTCHRCYSSLAEDRDVPLLAVLKDTLGDENTDNDRVISLWLLGYSPPDVWQRALSAIPFFYWRVSSGEHHGRVDLSPQLDLNALQHPMVNSLGRDALQWLMLDQSAMPIRATSRAYRTNQIDHERLALEESISYLRAASASGDEQALTADEIGTLIARLELRKTLLGGFVTQRGAIRYAEQDAAEHDRVRSRNWELLRQYSDKTGLYFEPLELAGTSGDYAIVWAPASGLAAENGSRLTPIWKLLNIRPPSRSELKRLGASSGYTRDFDSDGNLLPPGTTGEKQLRLVPLSAYSLSYPKMPLLMVDFRNGHHLRWRAITQRSINEVTAGVIGISHFTNWYYYVAADLYGFVAARHGAALNQSERLDCYSQFRVALALDRQLNSQLRAEMREQLESLAINPLERSPEAEIATAIERSQALQTAAVGGDLSELIGKARRAELISYSTTQKRALLDSFLHCASLGTYTRRAPYREEQLAELDTLRRTQTQLRFLDGATANGTQPEVAFDAIRIQRSLAELQRLLPEVTSQQMRTHAADTISRVQNLSHDGNLRADCKITLTALAMGNGSLSTGVALEVEAVRSQAHHTAAAKLP